MSEKIRWLGPYKETDRFADRVTIDHVIELRKRIEVLQKVVQEQHEFMKMVESRADTYREALWNIIKPQPPFNDEDKHDFTLRSLLDELHLLRETARNAYFGGA